MGLFFRELWAFCTVPQPPGSQPLYRFLSCLQSIRRSSLSPRSPPPMRVKTVRQCINGFFPCVFHLCDGSHLCASTRLYPVSPWFYHPDRTESRPRSFSLFFTPHEVIIRILSNFRTHASAFLPITSMRMFLCDRGRVQTFSNAVTSPLPLFGL